MQQKPASGQRVRRDFKLGDRVYVDVTYAEDAQKMEESKEGSNVVQLRMKPWKQDIFSNTVLFSTYKPDEICDTISQALQDTSDVKVHMSDKKWKMDYELSGAEPNQGCLVKVQLYSVDKERVAVEFQRMAGDSWFFREHFCKLKVPLQVLNDTCA